MNSVDNARKVNYIKGWKKREENKIDELNLLSPEQRYKANRISQVIHLFDDSFKVYDKIKHKTNGIVKVNDNNWVWKDKTIGGRTIQVINFNNGYLEYAREVSCDKEIITVKQRGNGSGYRYYSFKCWVDGKREKMWCICYKDKYSADIEVLYVNDILQCVVIDGGKYKSADDYIKACLAIELKGNKVEANNEKVYR